MRIAGHRERQALALADAEFRRRNNSPIPIKLTALPPYWALQADDDVKIDAFAYEEARALMVEALRQPLVAQGPPSTPWQRGASNPFWMVPSAAKRRGEAASVPWWKRIFAGDEPPKPSVLPMPAAAFDPYLREVAHRAVPQPESHVVYDEPFQTAADLDHLVSSTTTEWSASPPTVSGGGGPVRVGLPPGVPRPPGGGQQRPRPTQGKGGEKELLEYLLEITNAQASDLTPQQYLQIAIDQRNSLVAEGASKTLIAHWNREIRELNAGIKRMP